MLTDPYDSFDLKSFVAILQPFLAIINWPDLVGSFELINHKGIDIVWDVVADAVPESQVVARVMEVAAQVVATV